MLIGERAKRANAGGPKARGQGLNLVWLLTVGSSCPSACQNQIALVPPNFVQLIFHGVQHVSRPLTALPIIQLEPGSRLALQPQFAEHLTPLNSSVPPFPAQLYPPARLCIETEATSVVLATRTLHLSSLNHACSLGVLETRREACYQRGGVASYAEMHPRVSFPVLRFET